MKAFKREMLDDLKTKKELIITGEAGSSSGSDDAPSDDNFTPSVMANILPNEGKKKCIYYI